MMTTVDTSDDHQVTTIRETTNEESSSISGVLRYCKHRILCPYLKLLGAMGLKPINSDSHEMCTFSLLLNKFYIFVVVAVLFSGYTLQYLTCFRRDRGFAYSGDVLDVKGRHNPSFDNFHRGHIFGNGTVMELKMNPHSPNSSSASDIFGMRDICLGNPVYVHVLPGLLHMGSFFFMVYLYWFNDDEQLQNLMERVFIQAAHVNNNLFSKKKLVRTLQAMVLTGVSWVLLSISFQVVLIFTHSIFVSTWEKVGEIWMYIIVVLLVFTTFWQDAVQVTVITSYAIHCHLLATYLDLLHSRVQHPSITLSECIKEIGELEKLLLYLNNELANGLGPLLILNMTLAASSLIFLHTNMYTSGLIDLLCVSAFGLLWTVLVVFPMLQACKLSSSCKKVREFGHMVRMRPFGYQDVPQCDLDSFLLFVSTLKMEVKISKLPVSATSIAFLLGGCCLVLLSWGYFY